MTEEEMIDEGFTLNALEEDERGEEYSRLKRRLAELAPVY